MNYVLKTQDIYIENIKSGFKKFEYRLNDNKLCNLCAGDTLTLISPYNKINSVNVKVTNITIYSNWYDALFDTWRSDFKNIFGSLDETIDACTKFYSKEDVEKCGIIKIGIMQFENDLIDYDVLEIKKVQFKDLNINDEFFDSLREDYEGIKFNVWFKKKSDNDEFAYVYKKSQKIAGFLYLKKEIDEDNTIKPKFDKKTRLKVGTFKIDSSLASGFRLGERFLKIIFDNAINLKVDEIYITLFENKRKEVDVLKKLYLIPWGFEKWGTKISNNESVFVKKMNVYNQNKNIQFNFPNIKKNVNMYFLPILSEYHTNLFPDMILKTEDKEKYKQEFGRLYSLNKIYVSNVLHSKSSTVCPGDIVVIYRMGDPSTYKNYSSLCTGLAVIQEIIYPKSLNEYLEICSNKSVFSNEELIKFYNERKYRTVIKIIPLYTYKKKIILKSLREMKIYGHEAGPRTFDKISEVFKDKFLYNK